MLNQSYMAAHMCKHLEKRFECTMPDCSSTFRYPGNLKKHLRLVHGGAYGCHPCQVRFNRRTLLYEHWRSLHSNEPRYIARAASKNGEA